ncbi:hypothetical protein V8C35DRAFT_303766 [Trichoderma chlorosporum]
MLIFLAPWRFFFSLLAVLRFFSQGMAILILAQPGDKLGLLSASRAQRVRLAMASQLASDLYDRQDAQQLNSGRPLFVLSYGMSSPRPSNFKAPPVRQPKTQKKPPLSCCSACFFFARGNRNLQSSGPIPPSSFCPFPLSFPFENKLRGNKLEGPNSPETNDLLTPFLSRPRQEKTSSPPWPVHV